MTKTIVSTRFDFITQAKRNARSPQTAPQANEESQISLEVEELEERIAPVRQMM